MMASVAILASRSIFPFLVSVLALLRPCIALSNEVGLAGAKARVSGTSNSDSNFTLQTVGLWVCDPTVRRLLEAAPASVSRGEILGRCRKTYTKAACDAMQNALYRGPSVLDNLEYLCGPAHPSDLTANAHLVGAGAFQVGRAGVGFGPLGEAVQIPGANGKARTSFRGPSSPPLSGSKDLDRTVSGKTVGRKFNWEQPSRQNSSAIAQAADAVRVFDIAGLSSGSPMQSQVRMPKNTLDRTADITNADSTGQVSMNVSFKEPVIPEVIPPDVAQSAGNVVVQTPYDYAPYEGDWMEQSYFDATVAVPTQSPGTAGAALQDQLAPASASQDASTPSEETLHVEEKATDEHGETSAAHRHNGREHAGTKAAHGRRRHLQHSVHAKSSTASLDVGRPDAVAHTQSLNEFTDLVVESLLSRAEPAAHPFATGIAPLA